MRSLLLTLLLVGLCGCPFSVYNVNRLPTSQPIAEPVLFNQPGRLLHAPSGLEFAESYAGFERVTAYRYDTAGLDVGIGYNRREPDCLIVATFYVYPTPRMTFIGASPDVVRSIEGGWLEREYARSKAEIQQHHERMQITTEGTAVTPTHGAALQGRSLTFKEDKEMSELRLFVFDHKWFLKYRLTYPDSCQSNARQRIEELTSRLPWTTV